MLPQCSHVTRKRGIYYSRRLPGHRNGEVALSLRTRFFREAQWLAARMDIEFGRIIESVKDDTKTPDIPRIAREYHHDETASRIACLCGDNALDLVPRVNRSNLHLDVKGRRGGPNGRHIVLQQYTCFRVEKKRHAPCARSNLLQ